METLTDQAKEHLIYDSGKIPRTAFKVRHFVLLNSSGTIWTFFVLAVLCTLGRFTIRAFTPRRPSLDDYFVLLATAALATSWAILLKMLDSLYVVEAINDHQDLTYILLTASELPGVLSISKWSKIFVAMLWLSIFAIKGAFLVYFHILIRQLSRKINIYFWIVVFFNIASGFTLAFIDWADCPYVGEKALLCEQHFNHNTSLTVNTISPVLDIVCDIMIVSIPIMVLSLSHMSLWQKISYAGVLCLSVVMAILTIIRMAGTLATTHETNLGTSPIWGVFWEILEGCIAVIMSCFLTFRSLFAKVNHTRPVGAAARQKTRQRRPGGMVTMWERLLSALRLQSRYSRSPSTTIKDREAGLTQKNGDGLGESSGEARKYLIPTANITRPTLVFSRLRTLFGSTEETQISSEVPISSKGTIDVVTEFELRELDYHHILREEPASTSGTGSNRTEHRGDL